MSAQPNGLSTYFDTPGRLPVSLVAVAAHALRHEPDIHDVLNTAQAVHGAADLLPGQDDPDAVEELAQVVGRGAATLIEENEAQRDAGADLSALLQKGRGHVWAYRART